MEEPSCGRCDEPLTYVDLQKTTGHYWVNCKTCRDKHTAGRRKRRAQEVFDRTFIDDSSRGSSRVRYHSESEFEVESEDPYAHLPKLGHLPPSDYTRSKLALRLPLATSRPETSSSSSITIKKKDSGVSGKRDSITKKEDDTNDEHSFQEHHLDVVEELRPNVRECSVCGDSSLVQDYPSLMSCAHIPDVCQGCFLQWLEQQMRVGEATCPSSECTNIITHDDVQRYAPHELYTRFDELSMRALLRAEPDFLHCLAEGCSSGQIHDTGVEGPIFRCAACNFRICTAHDPPIPFHENESCAQYTKRIERNERTELRKIKKEQNDASVALVKRVTVRCPGCKVNIQKRSGCDHMTCGRKGCGFEFCYRCRAPYRGPRGIFTIGNHAHNSKCPHHTSRLPRQY